MRLIIFADAREQLQALSTPIGMRSMQGCHAIDERLAILVVHVQGLLKCGGSWLI